MFCALTTIPTRKRGSASAAIVWTLKLPPGLPMMKMPGGIGPSFFWPIGML